MNKPHRLLQALPHSVSFVDPAGVEWEQVQSAHYWMYQQFRYEYPGPIWDLHQRLMVVPLSNHGAQNLTGHILRVNGAKATIREGRDDYGNFILYLDLPYVDRQVDFEVWTNAERTASGGTGSLPEVGTEELDRYLAPTGLTWADRAIQEVADSLLAVTNDPWQLAQNISDWVYGKMQYRHGVTSVATSAPQALAQGEGLCQDYSHVMLAICRYVGLPARYISGHLLGEGGSHAWVEVILPEPETDRLVAVPFDPTNNCRGGLKHITVAVGRDYSDVSPTSGYYTAPYQGLLTSSKRAGLVKIEYFDGQQLSVDESLLSFLPDDYAYDDYAYNEDDLARRIA